MPRFQSLLKVVVGSALVWSSCRVVAGESDQSAADTLWSKLAAMSRDATRQQAAVRIKAYVDETIRLLDLPPKARAMFPTAEDPQTLQAVEGVYHRAAELSEATETVQRFNLDVPRIPLYGTISYQFVANDSQGKK